MKCELFTKIKQIFQIKKAFEKKKNISFSTFVFKTIPILEAINSQMSLKFKLSLVYASFKLLPLKESIQLYKLCVFVIHLDACMQNLMYLK